MKWRVSAEDVKRGKLITKPGWKLLEIIAFEEKLSKNKDSMNAIFDFRIIEDGPDNGLVIRVWFNEKAAGTATGFITALGGEPGPEGELEANFTPALVGRKLQGNVTRGIYTNDKGTSVSVNQIGDYSAIS